MKMKDRREETRDMLEKTDFMVLFFLTAENDSK
jgi:hypothetical protein